jgi:hypothetical protein
MKELIEPGPPGENHFYSYFQEMNDKATDAISRGEAEPERALEYLKQAEAFLKKIEKSRKNNLRTDVNQSGDSSFLNVRIQDQEKSVQVSRDSDPILDDDAEVAGHTIYRTNTAQETS